MPSCNSSLYNTPLPTHPQNDSTNTSNLSKTCNTVLTCCYLNSRSLVNKLTIFQSYVYSSDFDVICLTETWLTESIFDQEILPNNYNIYRKDRTTRGGVVLIAIKNTIATSVLNSNLPNNELEITTVKLNLHKPIIISCIYIPPCPSESYMNDIISNLTHIVQSNSSTDIIIIGDFNLPDIYWGSLSTTSPASRAFCDFVFDNSLTQLIDQPTHIKGNILDIILSNSNDLVTNLSIASDNSCISSDHFAIRYTPDLRHLSKCLRSSKKRFSSHPTTQLQLKITNLELESHNKALLAKSKYESQLVKSFAGSHNSRIYNYIRLLSKKNSIPSTLSLQLFLSFSFHR